MVCPLERGDNPRALASGLSRVHVDKHGMTILYNIYQISRYFVLKLVRVVLIYLTDLTPVFAAPETALTVAVSGIPII